MFLNRLLARPAPALLVGVLGASLFVLPATSPGTASPGVAVGRKISQEMASPPGGLLFVANAGQWPAAARFQAWGSPAGVGTTWLAEEAIWIVVAADDRVTGWQGDRVTGWQGDRVTGWQGDTGESSDSVVTRSPGHPVTLSPCHPVTQPLCTLSALPSPAPTPMCASSRSTR